MAAAMFNGHCTAGENRSRHATAGQELNEQQRFPAHLPQITPDDLIAFQSKHFGDNMQPAEWFVAPDQALNFQSPWLTTDDGLGYYADGVKRTLTDENIAYFREQELRDIEPKRQVQNAQTISRSTGQGEEPAAVAYESEASLSLAEKGATPSLPGSFPSRRSEASNSAKPQQRTKRRHEVPYDQRHKRKWEDHIVKNDGVHGSMTHRRLARELDEQHAESMELDY